MISKKIKYHDWDGEEREDVFYFNMNQAEFARLNGKFPGGLEAYTEKISKDKNVDELFMVIDTLVTAAYGERSGNGFIKKAPNGQPLSDFFVNTEAYDNLLTELFESEENLVNFMMSCLNKDSQDRAKAAYEDMKSKRAEEEKTKLTVIEGEKKP